MPAVKGYITSLGTMGILVSGALVLLAVVGALIAFNGWPGVGGDQEIGSLVVDGPERIAREAAPAAGAVAESPAPRARTSRTPRAALLPHSAPRGARGGTAAAFRDDGGSDRCCDPGTVISAEPRDLPPLAARCLLHLPVEGPLRCPVKSLRETEAPVTRALVARLSDATSQFTAVAVTSLDRLDPRLHRTVTDAGRLCFGSCPGSRTTSR